MPLIKSTAEITAPFFMAGYFPERGSICGRYPGLQGQILLAGSLPSAIRFLINRMICQQFLGSQDKIIYQSGCFLRLRYFRLHHERTERLQRHIMGRGAVQLFISPFYHQQMAILYTGIEMNPVRTQFFFQISNQHISFFGSDMSGGVIFLSSHLRCR